MNALAVIDQNQIIVAKPNALLSVIAVVIVPFAFAFYLLFTDSSLDSRVEHTSFAEYRSGHIAHIDDQLDIAYGCDAREPPQSASVKSH